MLEEVDVEGRGLDPASAAQELLKMAMQRTTARIGHRNRFIIRRRLRGKDPRESGKVAAIWAMYAEAGSALAAGG